jgi:predicted porin
MPGGLSLVHNALDDDAATLLRRRKLGFVFQAFAAKVFGGYRWMRDEGTTGTGRHDNLYWLGANYKFTPAFTLTGAAYYTDARTDSKDSRMFVLNADYALSKRTDAYLLLGYVNNKGNAIFGVTGTSARVRPRSARLQSRRSTITAKTPSTSWPVSLPSSGNLAGFDDQPHGLLPPLRY